MERREVKKVSITAEQFSPKLLYSHLFRSGDIKKGSKLPARDIFDYEIEFFIYGDGGMWVNDKFYEVKKGDVIFRRPGDWTQAVMPYDCYCIFFDLLGDIPKIPYQYDIYNDMEFQSFYMNPIIDHIPVQMHPSSSGKYLQLFDEILREFINPDQCSPLVTRSHILTLLKYMHFDAKDPFSQHNTQLSQSHILIKAVVEFIQDNFESKINLSHLAKVSNLSPNYLHQLFTKVMGTTPNEYIIKIRLEKAREILAKSSISISEVAMSCGFESISYFSYVFKKKLGLSPNEFRKKYDLYNSVNC